MPESVSHQPIRVTAQERSHPAVRKLARACIAIARQQLCTDRQHDTAKGGAAQPQGQEVTND